MNIQKTDNSTSFGWRPQLHADMAVRAMEGKSLPEFVEKIIQRGTQKPDYYEASINGQRHFYFPDNKFKSFLDIMGTRNARYTFTQHARNIFRAIRHSNPNLAFEEIGCSMHYLQDMTQPHHITPVSILRRAKETELPHNNFEVFASENEAELLENYKQTYTFNSKSLPELFKEVVELSRKNKVPKASNQEEWMQIAQDGINLSVDASKHLLKLVGLG